MKISAVEKLKNKNMMRIFIDDHYSFTIPQADYIRNRLYEEEEITEEKLDRIRKNVLARAAKERAVRYLTIKDRSEGELQKKLIDAGFDESIAQAAADSLKALGYLNDSRYAMRYLAERMRTKALSKKALRYELEHKSIPPEIIDTVFSEFETDDEEVALRAAKKKFGKYDLNDQKVVRKIVNFLLHRGFSFGVGYKVLKLMKENQQ